MDQKTAQLEVGVDSLDNGAQLYRAFVFDDNMLEETGQAANLIAKHAVQDDTSIRMWIKDLVGVRPTLTWEILATGGTPIVHHHVDVANTPLANFRRYNTVNPIAKGFRWVTRISYLVIGATAAFSGNWIVAALCVICLAHQLTIAVQFRQNIAMFEAWEQLMVRHVDLIFTSGVIPDN